MAVKILHTASDRSVASETIDVTLSGTYPVASLSEATDVVAQARADSLARLGPGEWRMKFDVALDDPNATWIVVVEAVKVP